MRFLLIKLITASLLVLVSFTSAGDLQNLFREVNSELIAQDQQNTSTSGFGGMDKSGNITPGVKNIGVKPIGSGFSAIPHGIEEIGIERTPCFGSCPAYTFTVRQDGSFTYVGEQHVLHVGTFTGNLASHAVRDVFLAINDLDYMALNYKYSSNMLDAAAVYSKVVKFGEAKVIENYASTGPGRLLAVELLIDSLVAQIDWDTVVDEASY